ncbi:hypothetical protein WG66_006069 [Moniliophthora roreri]|nr:hypothetical protein WG66_006069 [Moniliophthora roreri]
MPAVFLSTKSLPWFPNPQIPEVYSRMDEFRVSIRNLSAAKNVPSSLGLHMPPPSILTSGTRSTSLHKSSASAAVNDTYPRAYPRDSHPDFDFEPKPESSNKGKIVLAYMKWQKGPFECRRSFADHVDDRMPVAMVRADMAGDSRAQTDGCSAEIECQFFLVEQSIMPGLVLVRSTASNWSRRYESSESASLNAHVSNRISRICTEAGYTRQKTRRRHVAAEWVLQRGLGYASGRLCLPVMVMVTYSAH